jgi:hypothetical protein
MTKTWLLLLVLALSTSLVGCQSKEAGAREKFSKEFTCPAERVEVRERSDLKPSMLRAQVPPPPDVAADPARLAMWKAEEETNNENADQMCDMLEARGCNQQSLVCCRRHTKRINEVSCMTHQYANGVSRW